MTWKKTSEALRNAIESLKYGRKRKKLWTHNFLPNKNISQKQKHICRWGRVGKAHYQKTYAVKPFQGNPSSRRTVISDRNCAYTKDWQSLEMINNM